MTILVTYKTEDKIYIGSDTQQTGYVVGHCTDKWAKVMINDENYIWIGCTGYAKFADFFQYGFKAPHYYKEDDFVHYLHNQLAPKITEILSKRKIAEENKNRLETDSIFLIVYDDVYSLYSDAAPLKEYEDFTAVGSGSRLAYGAYHVYSSIHDMNVETNINEMIHKTLDAAIYYDPYCSGKHVIHVMERAK